MVFLGISDACSVRVGNFLGSNQPKHAILTSKLSLALVVCIGMLFSSLVIGFRHQISALLINDPPDLEPAATALLVLEPYEIIDGLNCVIQGCQSQ